MELIIVFAFVLIGVLLHLTKASFKVVALAMFLSSVCGAIFLKWVG